MAVDVDGDTVFFDCFQGTPVHFDMLDETKPPLVKSRKNQFNDLKYLRKMPIP